MHNGCLTAAVKNRTYFMSLKYFFLLFASTILITRLLLWLMPKHGPTIAGLQLHHYMYGLVLIFIYILTKKHLLLAIGSALVVDEIPLFFIFGTRYWPYDHWKQYHSWQSIIGILIISTLLYSFFRFLWLPSTITPMKTESKL